MSPKNKNTGLKICVVIMSIVIIILSSIIAIDYFSLFDSDESQTTSSDRLLDFTRIGYENELDPYGLSGSKGILGERIDSVLDGYTEGEDYSYDSNDYFCSYTFDDITYHTYSERPKLKIFTDAGKDYVSLVEYSFFISGSGFTTYMALKRFDSILTEYYDKDALYTYTSNTGSVSLTSDEFYERLDIDYEDLTYIEWETDTVRTVLTISNKDKNKRPSCTISYAPRNK